MVSKVKQSIIDSVVAQFCTKATTIFDYSYNNKVDYFYKHPRLNKQHFDIVTLTFTLNALPKKSRIRMLHNAYNKVKPGGLLIVAVQSNKSITRLAKKHNWASYEDGFITSSKDAIFQHGFTNRELESLLLMLSPVSMTQLLCNTESICYSVTKL